VGLGRHFGDGVAHVLTAVAWAALRRDWCGGLFSGGVSRLRGVWHYRIGGVAACCGVLREMNGAKYMYFRDLCK
jgi:hypothetical protein